jgi:hypothetical protein
MARQPVSTSPELNELDVAERRSWSLTRVLAELEQGYAATAPVLTAAGGKLDGVVLGEWVHGGDVREALGEPGAYDSDGVEDALVLLVERSRRQAVPATLVRLPDRELRLGVSEDATSVAQLATDMATAGHQRPKPGPQRDPSVRHPWLADQQLPHFLRSASAARSNRSRWAWAAPSRPGE